MTDKQINRWLRRQFSVVGWVLIGYYLLVNGLTMIAMLWETLWQMKTLIGQRWDWWMQLDMEALASNAWGYIMAIVVLFLILHAWKGSRYWRTEVLMKEKPMRIGVLLAVLFMCMGSQMINAFWVSGLEWVFNAFDKSLLPLLESVSGTSDTFSMFLYASLLGPVAEELLFRGFILRSLQPYGKKFAVFASALLFGLFHGNLLQTPYAFLMGLLLGWVTVEYSIVWAILVHIFNNLVLADLLTRLTAGLSVAVADMIHLSLLGGGLAISGVIIFCKRREIAAYLGSEWMDRRVLKCFFTNAGILLLTLLMIGTIFLMMP